MNDPLTIGPADNIADKAFTNPDRIVYDVNTMRFMVDQLCLFMENRQQLDPLSPPTITHLPDRENWLYRLVIARPEILLEPRELAFVGFLGQRREDADLDMAHEFDEILVDEIPDHPGLLSYSTMALVSGDFTNLVIFTDNEVKEQWSRSMAHAQAVQRLSPNYYLSIKLYNGYLPGGIVDSRAMQLTRVKYFDYQATPLWRAERVFPEGS